MKRNLLSATIAIVCLFSSLSTSKAQNLEITFRAGGTVLAGVDTVYMYSGIGVSNPSDHWQYGVGELVSPGTGIGRMGNYGIDTWGICIDLPHYYDSGPAGAVPLPVTIYNVDMLFHNKDFSKSVSITSTANQIFFTLTPNFSETWGGTVDGAIQVCNLGLNDVNVSSSLLMNYPNPVSEKTKFIYSLKTSGKASLKVYNAIGQSVKTVVNEFQNPGTYTFDWNGDNDSGRKLFNGVYYYTLTVDGKTVQTNKLVLSR